MEAQMPTATPTETKAPTGPTAARLERLRETAAGDREAAQAEAWAWFEEAGEHLLGDDREATLAELGELFASGRPSRGIDGPTEGALVGFTARPAFDRAMGAITGLWLPWVGKRFDAGQETGENLLLRSARLPARLLWPLYAVRSEGERAVAFSFSTRVEPGKLDPGTDVLVIDYAEVEDNPRLIIKSIRDELVEIVPGAHLGKMLWRHGDGERHSLLAYFALRSQL
jgi:hypothetical protein